MIGRTLEVTYGDPRVCDTCVFLTVSEPDAAGLVSLLVLSDPLDGFGGALVIKLHAWSLEKWTVREW